MAQSMTRFAASAAIVVLCVACVPVTIKTSDVTSVGNGYYRVVSTPSYNTNWSDLRFHSLDVARDYCARQDKKMLPVHVNTHGTSRWGDQDMELTFECARPEGEQKG